jgi:hypothetical protein
MENNNEGITVITKYSPNGVDQIRYPGENGTYGLYFPQEKKLVLYDKNNTPIKETTINSPAQATQNTFTR